MSDAAAANEYREAQRQFMVSYTQFLIEKLKLRPEAAQQVAQKMMVNSAKTVAQKNLEDLNDFARDYIVGKDL